MHLEAEKGREVTWRDLRFPLDRLVKVVFAQAAASGMTGQAIPGGSRFDALTDAEADAAFDAALEVSGRRKPRSLDDQFLQRVADVYRDALRDESSKVRRSPTREVARRLDGSADSYHAAKAWVGKARAAGYLPPTVAGRKAG